MPPGVDRPVHVLPPKTFCRTSCAGFAKGGEVSDRQWRDVIGIVRVQGPRLDRVSLAHGAGLLGVTDLLERALAQQ